MIKLIIIAMVVLLAGCTPENDYSPERVDKSRLPAGATNVTNVTHDAATYTRDTGWITFELEGSCFLYFRSGRASVLSRKKC